MLEGGRLMLALDGVSKVYKVGTFGGKQLRAVILRHGEIVEAGATAKVFGNPLHPYTRMLLTSVPQLHTKWDTTTPRPVVEQTSGETAARLVEVEPDHLVATAGEPS
jgi:peptide/nickel transport system ATP-binding protein